MKLSEIPYARPDLDAAAEYISKLTVGIKNAVSANEQKSIYDEMTETVIHIDTMSSLAYIRFTLNTEDKFYSDEMDYYDEKSPVFTAARVAFGRELLASSFRKELENLLSPVIFKNYEIAAKSFSDEIIEESQEDNRLCTEYKKLLTSAKIEFNGELLNLPQLGKYKESRDREVRCAAFDAHGKWMKAHGEEFDDIFDRMVKVRDKMAKKMGYENYVELGYYRMGRNCYTPDDIAAFRQQVLTDWVPFVCELKKKQAEKLGIDRIMLYDDTIWLKDGNPEPIGTPEEIFASGKKMYESMSPLTGEFIRFMLDNELLDVLARAGKSCGGYSTELAEYGMPFIFANFNGTYGDVDVLTHEAGHAYASYKAMKEIPLYELRQNGMETCEVHSMSMEFFAWRSMELFFGDKADDYRYMHFSNAASFIPYGTMVDYFQQLVYEKPEMTPADRRALWLELEHKFRPYLGLDGITYMEEGGRWQYQSHIFERPFYYIDYCLAQTVAFDFLIAMKKDYDDAFKRYDRFVSDGGTKYFTDLVAEAGFKKPFEQGALKEIIKSL